MALIFKYLLFLLVAWTSLAEADESLPTIYGTAIGRNIYFENITLPREFPRYNVRGHNNASAITIVNFENSKLAVFSPDFCQTYNNLETIWAQDTSIEVILPGSLDDCPKVDKVYFNRNLIKELPANWFKNSIRLYRFGFDYNLLEKLPNDLLPSWTNLSPFYLRHNNFKEFPTNIYNSDHSATYYIEFTSNDATDLNAREIKKHLPSLLTIHVGDNLIPCSRIPGIIAEFAELGVRVLSGETERKVREQQVRWGSVDGISCVDDS